MHKCMYKKTKLFAGWGGGGEFNRVDRVVGDIVGRTAAEHCFFVQKAAADTAAAASCCCGGMSRRRP